MANFNRESTKKLVKDILTIDDSIFNNPNYLDNLDEAGLPDEERMIELFGDKGYEMIKELIEFNQQFEKRHSVSEPTIRQLVTREIYNKFSPDELEDMSINDIIDDPRIDWDVLVDAFESRYADRADADAVKKAVGLIIGRNLGAEASFTRANLNQVNNNAERRLLEEDLQNVNEVASNERRKASFFRNTTIGTGIFAVASTTAVVILAILLARSSQNLNEYKEQLDKAPVRESYVAAEQLELADFNDMLKQLNVNGLTPAKIATLEQAIADFEKTDDPQQLYSSTSEMKAVLAEAVASGELANLQNAYNRLDKKYQTLLASQPTTPVQAYDYVQFLVEINDVQEMLVKALADNQFTDDEKKDIKDKLALIDVNKSQVAKTLADTFGTTVDEIYETIDFQVATVKADVDKLQKEVNNLITTINQQTTIINKQTATIDDKNKIITRLNNENAQYASDIVAYELQIVTLEDYIDALQKQLANSGSGSNQLLIDQLTDALKDLNKVKAELNKVKSENALLVIENNNLKTDLADLESEIDTLTTQVGTLNAQVKSLDAQVKDLTSKNSVLTSEVAAQTAKTAEIEKKYDELIGKYNEEVKKYNKLFDEYEILEEKYNNATTDAEKQELINQISEKTQQILQLEAQLKENSDKLNDLSAKLSKAEAENEELIKKLAYSDAGFIEALYESLGKNPAGKTQEQMIAELSEMFDLELDNIPSNSTGDLGNQPIK